MRGHSARAAAALRRGAPLRMMSRTKGDIYICSSVMVLQAITQSK